MSEKKRAIDAEAAFHAMGGGANQAGARAYNERLTLSLIRRNGPLPKAALARLTGLSAQTLSQIMRRLEADQLVVPQPPMRGRIGQPSVPFALNPDGALSFGLKIGRRSTDVVLCDFLGKIRDRARRSYAYPMADEVLAFATAQILAMRARQEHKDRVIGTGVAMPFEIWKWEAEVEAPHGALDAWRTLDVAVALKAATGLPVLIANDATAACGAELARADRGPAADFLYIFLGSFIGGGVVLNGALFAGRSGNAGALGSMPVFLSQRSSQLISHASLVTLERELKRAGLEVADLQSPNYDWSTLGPPLDHWIRAAAQAIATASVAAVSVIDFPLIVVDGSMPPAVLAQLVAAIQVEIAKLDLQGLSTFRVEAGTLGSDARALGGAMLPILANFTCDPDVLLKSIAPQSS